MAPPRSKSRFLARTAKGAKPADMPGFIDPALATLREQAPIDDRWIHEVKFDGWRVQAHLKDRRASLYTRQGHNWSRQFDSITRAVEKLPANNLILDGEIVAADANGVPAYTALIEKRPAQPRNLAYFVFDLLYMDGFDLRDAPLIERKRVLESFLNEARSDRLLYSEHLEGSGANVLKHACKLRYEGIVSKRRDSRYRSGRTGLWEKIKCVSRGDFLIIGFAPAQPQSISALYLATQQGRKLRYAGKVGVGFSVAEAQSLRNKLEKLMVGKAPIAGLQKPKAKWVTPNLTAIVEFRDLSAAGELRHPSFKGLKASERQSRGRVRNSLRT